MGDILALINDFSSARFIDTRDQVEDRGLSSPIGAHHSKNFSFLDVESEVIDSGQVSKGLCQVLYSKNSSHFRVLMLFKSRKFIKYCLICCQEKIRL
jgi:hypothetical protein